MDYFEDIKVKHPNIVAFEEDDDDWDNDGFSALKGKRYEDAISIFEKLCLSQPRHHSGYEGLAYVYYSINDQEKAVWFMNKALEFAREFLKDDSIDIEVIEYMEKNLKNMLSKEVLRNRW